MTTEQPPLPVLKIVCIEQVLAHEEHDSQRAQPLMERLRHADLFTNPPIVAPMGDDQHYVILDGANRCYSFAALGYPHIMVQEVSYDSGLVSLETWHHIVSDWDADEFAAELRVVDGVEVVEGSIDQPLAQLTLRDNRTIALHTRHHNWYERNAILRRAVSVYQRKARLFRTVLNESAQIWSLYNRAIALVRFPRFRPEDIIAAARERAYLPPGISRHIIEGRAIRLNYPMDWLRDRQTSLTLKNDMLQAWMRQKLANRQVRFYAESTYQFDE